MRRKQSYNYIFVHFKIIKAEILFTQQQDLLNKDKQTSSTELSSGFRNVIVNYKCTVKISS